MGANALRMFACNCPKKTKGVATQGPLRLMFSGLDLKKGGLADHAAVGAAVTAAAASNLAELFSGKFTHGVSPF